MGDVMWNRVTDAEAKKFLRPAGAAGHRYETGIFKVRNSCRVIKEKAQ